MDFSKPIEIADNIYWVGYVIPNDPFQCHVYLIKNGENSILIDPGSMITFPVVLEKITSLISLKDIKYIIMHHQDPDIVSCYSTFEKILPKSERYIVTHWRSEMLLKHYNWDTPFYMIDQNNWNLKAGDRELEFIFTPYAHFPGAFCTYDKKTGIVFSSDLFGGLTEKFELYANDVDSYFKAAEPFHKHYMPSKEVLDHALIQIEKKNPKMIAPQHGSIIKKELIKPLIDKLKTLECGLYLLDDYESDIYILNTTDKLLNKFLQDTVSLSSFNLVLENLFLNLKHIISFIEIIKICGISPVSHKKYCFTFHSENNTYKIEDLKQYKKELIKNNKVVGNIFIDTIKELNSKEEKMLNILLDKISIPVAISLEKELILKDLEENNKLLYKRAITDQLTELYNRAYMKDYLDAKIIEANRYHFPLTIAMIDIDFFKNINDTYGHLMGDCVLKELAHLLTQNFRNTDVIIRYGGEEFFIIMPFITKDDACLKMEEFRKLVENYIFCNKKHIKLTISIGVTQFENEKVDGIIQKVDMNLYEAKRKGRNRVICK
jgi:diguanylate cyclase (GGDEF)-like protein